MKRGLLFLAALLLLTWLPAQSDFYRLDTIQDIEVFLSQSNWDYQMDTAKYGSEGYLLADSVRINGVTFDSAGIKYKGNSSFDSTLTKNPLHIKLDFVHPNANYLGYEDIKLSNGYMDPSWVREAVGYAILGQYMPTPRSNFARIYINGGYFGVYSNAQSIDNYFLSTHFFSTENSFFKCNPANVLGGQIPNLLYLGQDSTLYYPRYELESNSGWADLIDLCDTLNNAPSYVNRLLNVDRALWMLSFNNTMVNLDSYTGAFAQNYYLYQDDYGLFQPVVWDLNMCFGGFSNTGTSMLTPTAMETMSPSLHSAYGARPLIVKALADTIYGKQYYAHMRTMVEENLANGYYSSLATTFQALIDSSVQAEPYSIFLYSQFQSSLTTTYVNIPGLQTLMDARAAYLPTSTELTPTPPAISSISLSNATPAFGDTIWVTATFSNATWGYLGNRDQLGKPFTRTRMYDDGLHHDGAAGDQVFGASMVATSAYLQYYLYSQNSAAGIFSPERAEYEFYGLTVTLQTANVGELKINEFLADNQADTTDGTGQHEDWIELFNTTGNPLSLFGLYLTDDATNLMKYAFPEGTSIPAHGFLAIWADEDPSTPTSLHCNFKLSAGGEEIWLSNGQGTVLDNIVFGPQSTDISMGRCPDGTGAFGPLSPPSLMAHNCPIAIEDPKDDHPRVDIFPNPASERVFVRASPSTPGEWALLTIEGREVRKGQIQNGWTELDCGQLPAGMYLLRMVWPETGQCVSAKVSIQR